MNLLTERFFTKRVEPCFTVLALLHYSQGIVPLLITRGANEGDGTDILSFNYLPNLALFLLIYLITAGLLLLRWKKVLHLVRQDGWIWSIVALAGLSILWSADPPNTRSAVISLVGTTLFGLYFATRYSFKEQLQLLAWMFGISMVLSILFAIALPKYGIMAGVHDGALRGIYTHKNVLGRTLPLAGVVFVLLAGVLPARRRLLLSGLAVLFVLLFLARSTAGTAILIVLLVAWIAYRILRWQNERLVPVALMSITLAIGLFMVLSQTIGLLFGIFGEDVTLTGRTEIWPLVVDMIQKRPWLGYGFNGFWHGIQGESAYVVRAMRWPVPDSHNGLLDLWLSLGFVGVCLFFWSYWATLIRGIACARQGSPLNLWPLLFLTYFVLINIAESSLLSQNTIFWMLYTAVAFSALTIPQQIRETSAGKVQSVSLP
ncbi:O-antigen ligase family protein [Leptolyngbya ohadii]|uniref:O-antigen ligase family protein n=1 Tax=Leptolyngbya ohadii TaxID=1962290 RepID=UPI000B59C4BA|nr:O-antigen ligase [Leptolyngbya ohadii]